MTDSGTDLLAHVLNSGEPFAIIHRSHPHAATTEIFLGEVDELGQLADINAASGQSGLLVTLPYRQIRERGFDCLDDEAPLLALKVTHRQSVSPDDLTAFLPACPVDLSQFEFDISDARYQRIVKSVISEEIGAGLGSNFVISRSLTGFIPDPIRGALSLFRRLLITERGAYWTFLINLGSRIFVGASPEAHVVLSAGQVTMNPISGTYRYPESGDAWGPSLLEFLHDQKEADELFMVVDEELKMMARVCPEGGIVSGPHLKAMAHLAHTEYLLTGRVDLDSVALLRETMFAPTVVGSPLQSACRVIARHEPAGRGYYSGVAALIERDHEGRERMDSAILIRTMLIEADGHARVGVGSTLVRESTAIGETLETHAKAAAFVKECSRVAAPVSVARADVREALNKRNLNASAYWFATPHKRRNPATRFNQRVTLIDAEDDFSAMLATMLRSLGFHVSIVAVMGQFDVSEADMVVFGPGPGNPVAATDPRVAALRRTITHVAETGVAFLAVCLSHQILCDIVGLPLYRLARPTQGSGRDVNIFGDDVRLGFYNTFVARCDSDFIDSGLLGRIEVSRDMRTHEVHALRGRGFTSFQFHVESVLSRDGARQLALATYALLSPRARQRPA